MEERFIWIKNLNKSLWIQRVKNTGFRPLCAIGSCSHSFLKALSSTQDNLKLKKTLRNRRLPERHRYYWPRFWFEVSMKSCKFYWLFLPLLIRASSANVSLFLYNVYLFAFIIVLYLILFTFNQNPNMTSIKVAIRCRPYTVDDKLGVKIRQVTT